MSVIELQDGVTTFPWLVFRIEKNYCALNSSNISAIQMMPEYVQRVPNSSNLLRGLFDMRGEAIPLLDLRLLLGYPTLETVYRDFAAMLETRKQEHLHWIDELERCVLADEPFTLATDPHQCTFGKWYDTFESDLDSINHLLGKIEEPHRLLHETALVVEKQRKDHAGENTTALMEAIHRAKEHYVPTIVTLLEEAIETFKVDFREEVFVLGISGDRIGITVDQIVSSELLSDVTMMTKAQVFSSPYVLATAKCKTTDKPVLMLDEEKIQHCLEG